MEECIFLLYINALEGMFLLPKMGKQGVDGLLWLFVGHMGVACGRELEGVGGSCPLSSLTKQKW